MRKIRLTSKFMMSQPEKQTIGTHILPNTLRSKGNQSQLIEYNMRNIFLGTLYRKCGGETIPRPFF